MSQPAEALREPSLASPTIENSNRLMAWMRGLDLLRKAVGGAVGGAVVANG